MTATDLLLADLVKLYASKDLPMRQELIAELTLWRCHAEDGVNHVRRADQVLQAVMNHVSPTAPRRR